MRCSITRWIRVGILTVAMSTPVAFSAAREEPTAFALIKEGNRYIGEQAKDQVVQIRSEKSVASLIPSIWYISYYDPTAAFKAVEVKLGSGKMLDVSRPFRMIQRVTGAKRPLESDLLKVDSDQAIQTVLKEPLLANLTIRATAAKLERGENDQPVWKVRIWAAKLRDPSRDANLGEVILSAEDGRILENNLKIRRVD